jgi:transposase
MRHVREIITNFHVRGLSQADSGLGCGVGRTTVQNYLGRLAASGVPASEALALGDAELASLLFPEQPRTAAESATERPLPDWGRVATELRRKGVTRRLLWMEYSRDQGQGEPLLYSQFCKLLASHAGEARLSMRQEHKGGEAVFTDYSGDRAHWVEKATGEVHHCDLFVMCWGASSYTYAEPQPSQQSEHWLSGHVRAYAFYGCCPRREVIDNLKGGVTKADRYDPDANPAFADMSHHYNVAVVPARPMRPKDKPKVENAVQQAQRWILAAMRNDVHHSLDELSAAVRARLVELNARPMRDYAGKSRRELFEELDRPAAQELPATPWVLRRWVRCKAGPDYCVQVDKRHYSVPHAYAGRQLEAVIGERLVEVFCEGEQIAVHERIAKPYGFSIKPEHRPEKHDKVCEWNPGRIFRWASGTGPETVAYVQGLFASKHNEEEAYRPALGMMRYAEKHPAALVEKACRIALTRRLFKVSQFREVLSSPLIRRELEPEAPAVRHGNLRGLGAYGEQSELVFEPASAKGQEAAS